MTTSSSLRSRPPEFDRDLTVISELIAVSSPKTRHRIDYRWRLCNPLVWAGQNALLWFEGDLCIAFAAWQQPWATLDFFVRLGPWREDAERAIFAWASTRFHELDQERGRPLPYWVEAREDDEARLALLERHGYVLEDDHDYVMLVRELSDELDAPPIPAGYAIRSLAGEAEVEAYAELHRRAFGSQTVTAEWRARSLRMPGYRADLDLVVVAPDGRLVGFCVGWLDESERVAQIEPIGVDPAFQGRGISRMLLRESLRRFQSAGATVAQVETETTRTPARRAYEASGFRPAQRSVRRGQWFS